jgi:acetyl-CoA acetyltransferase
MNAPRKAAVLGGIRLQDFDIYEIPEAFAATGTRIVATLAKQLAQRGSGRRLVSVCTAGGMGVTAVLER